MGDPLIIFKAISGSADQQLLFQRLLSEGGKLQIKDSNDNSMHLKALSIDGQRQLLCQLPKQSHLSLADERFSVTFSVGADKYLFDTEPIFTQTHLILPVKDLFHLQRRRNFRYTLPKDYHADLMIKSLNGKGCQHKTRLIDLSTEGCAVEITHEQTELSLNDLVDALIHLGPNPIPIQGYIRNIRARDNDHLVLGIEFDHVIHASEILIIQSIANLQREIFQRKAS